MLNASSADAPRFELAEVPFDVRKCR